jgi:hypothetical protein
MTGSKKSGVMSPYVQVWQKTIARLLLSRGVAVPNR